MDLTSRDQAAATTEPAAVHAARSHGDGHSRELVEAWDGLLAEVERLRTEKAGSDAGARRAWETVRRSADRQARGRKEALDALDVLTEYVRESAEKRAFGKTMAQEALGIVRTALETA